MLIPVLLTLGIAGATYAFGRVDTTRTEEPPTRVIPNDQIPTPLRDQMQRAITGLPPNLQGALPPTQWGDPSAWIRLAQQAPQNAPELNAIANALRLIPLPTPTPTPTPIPNFIPGPPVPLDQVPADLRAQLQAIVLALPAPYQNAIPGLNPNLPPPLVPPTVDPAALVTLANTIQAAIPTNPAPPQLRAIAQRLSPQTQQAQARAPMNTFAAPTAFAAPAPDLGALGGSIPGYNEARQTYEGIRSLLQQYGQMQGAPVRVGQTTLPPFHYQLGGGRLFPWTSQTQAAARMAQLRATRGRRLYGRTYG